MQRLRIRYWTKFVVQRDGRIGYGRHIDPVPADQTARADRTDDRHGHFPKPAPHRGSHAVPGLRPGAQMEARRCLGGRRSEARLLRLSAVADTATDQNGFNGQLDQESRVTLSAFCGSAVCDYEGRAALSSSSSWQRSRRTFVGWPSSSPAGRRR
jgi:hypothetical protein